MLECLIHPFHLFWWDRRCHLTLSLLVADLEVEHCLEAHLSQLADGLVLDVEFGEVDRFAVRRHDHLIRWWHLVQMHRLSTSTQEDLARLFFSSTLSRRRSLECFGIDAELLRQCFLIKFGLQLPHSLQVLIGDHGVQLLVLSHCLLPFVSHAKRCLEMSRI